MTAWGRPFLDSRAKRGHITTLAHPSAIGFDYAYAINARGTACGASTAPSAQSHAAVYANGTVTDLGTLDGLFSSCFLGSSNRGEFVGYPRTADFSTHAFVTGSGVMTDLNSLVAPGSGWELTFAYGMNERGQVVGGALKDGQQRAYLATP